MSTYKLIMWIWSATLDRVKIVTWAKYTHEKAVIMGVMNPCGGSGQGPCQKKKKKKKH